MRFLSESEPRMRSQSNNSGKNTRMTAISCIVESGRDAVRERGTACTRSALYTGTTETLKDVRKRADNHDKWLISIYEVAYLNL